jgi:CheY-like chemotaxis protein
MVETKCVTDEAPLILIVDDEDLIRSTLSKALEMSGFRVATAADGNEGLRLYEELKPDVLVTDILMPAKEGIETILELRRKGARIPIIAISGGDRSGNQFFLDIADRLGATHVLPKPFRPAQLIALINDSLQAG